MVTAPLAKHVIRDGAAADFTGHTEYLCARAGVERVVMMLVADQLRVALLTTHLPLRDVADAITESTLSDTLNILEHDLRQHFGIAAPNILVLGLNPHAGEDGHLGSEELNIIIPTLARLRQRGLRLTGPLPADTAFTPRHLQGHNAVLAMYHDQSLPVLKFAGFGEAVNITLGLPFIRTSVDHGTAFDLAGSGRAEPGSLIAATKLAVKLAQQLMQKKDTLENQNMQHQARKRFGQHFLTDTSVVERMVRAIAPTDEQIVVEIGPGQGALTLPLLDQIKHLHVVELDRDLIEQLERRIAKQRITIHSADALKFDLSSLVKDGQRIRVVGNLPYNISTPLMFHLLDQVDVIEDMHFMLQKEVVDRLVAAPSTSDWGRLSMMIQYYCHNDYLFFVPPTAFSPDRKSVV